MTEQENHRTPSCIDWMHLRNEFEPLLRGATNAPPLNEKLLSRPPFKFLLDLFMVLLEHYEFGSGLLDENEMRREHYIEKTSKLNYLLKYRIYVAVIGRREECENHNEFLNPRKVLAGLDVEKTSVWLLRVARLVAEGHPTQWRAALPRTMELYHACSARDGGDPKQEPARIERDGNVKKKVREANEEAPPPPPPPPPSPPPRHPSVGNASNSILTVLQPSQQPTASPSSGTDLCLSNSQCVTPMSCSFGGGGSSHLHSKTPLALAREKKEIVNVPCAMDRLHNLIQTLPFTEEELAVIHHADQLNPYASISDLEEDILRHQTQKKSTAPMDVLDQNASTMDLELLDTEIQRVLQTIRTIHTACAENDKIIDALVHHTMERNDSFDAMTYE